MASGGNKQLLKSTYKKANNELNFLNEALIVLKRDVEEMNTSVWSGGTSANKWYDAVNVAYQKDTKFQTKAKDLQSKLAKRIERLDMATGSTATLSSGVILAKGTGVSTSVSGASAKTSKKSGTNGSTSSKKTTTVKTTALKGNAASGSKITKIASKKPTVVYGPPPVQKITTNPVSTGNTGNGSKTKSLIDNSLVSNKVTVVYGPPSFLNQKKDDKKVASLQDALNKAKKKNTAVAANISNKAKSAATSVATATKTGATTAATKVANAARTAKTEAANAARLAAGGVSKGAQTAATKIANAAGAAKTGAENAARTAVSSISSGAQTAATKIATSARTAASSVSSGAQTAAAKIASSAKAVVSNASSSKSSSVIASASIFTKKGSSNIIDKLSKPY